MMLTMKVAANSAIFGVVTLVMVCVVFFGSGVVVPRSLSNALFPGFFLSTMLTVRDHAAFGDSYVVIGLLLNAAIYATVLLLSAKLVDRIRHTKSR